MNNFATKMSHDNSIVVIFPVESDEVIAIGEKMNAINDEAYMNGYNWEAFLNHYLQIHHTNLLEGLEGDPEAGMFVAVYDKDSEGDIKADQLAEVINGLIADPDRIYEFLRSEGDDIEWD